MNEKSSPGAHVEILLATFNGEAYLSEQIRSVVTQTYRNWKLIIHDDGSSDATLDIIGSFCQQYPTKISLIRDGMVFRSSKLNFAHLLRFSKADYVMFCDQDDVWFPGKVERTMMAIIDAENVHGRSTPLAVFTDLEVVDRHLGLISKSLWKYQGVDPGLAHNIKMLALRNCLTGCTMMLNRAAVVAVMPLEASAVMHDWWCGLRILQLNGFLYPLREPTASYRQHESNVFGASKKRSFWGKAMIFIDVLNKNIITYRMARSMGIFRSPFEYIWQKVKLQVR